ncbi:MAG: 3-methyl-2-oxobutanoate dehydrogenase subunit VorB [Chloroflexi bacterium]|nr:3-methyl-2-oxobutanoate dehydrogenase subunit VorB [Chloroflexota bacterium]
MKQLLKGNEAIAEAAVRAGCEAYFGYPITPQTELLEYMSRRMPDLKRAFLQAESEVAAINMVYGAACTGTRVMTSSSSPGISLMMEGISYIFASEVPMVLVDVMRGGPGLGNIAPSQADYFQVVKGGGHGDYHPLVLAPATVQEAIDLTYESFDLAEKYRTVVVILLDGCIGQMMEPAELPPMRALANQPAPSWALRGKGERERKNIITSIYLVPEVEEEYNRKLQRKLADMRRNEVRYREYFTDDAEYLVVGFGTSGRVALTAVKQARARGMKVGLLRPISLYPFPTQRLEELARQVKNMLVVEMNAGQMIEDVRLAVNGRVPVRFYGRMGGMVPLPDEVLKEIREMVSVGEETKHFHFDIQNELGEWNAIDDLEVEEEWR